MLDIVGPKFRDEGHLLAADFFCIVIWKANRVKSKIATKMLKHGYENLDAAAKALTSGLAQQTSAKDRLRYLFEEWKFGLPMASAILTILYPDEFTLYDVRVCDMLDGFHNLKNRVNFENLWHDYQTFKRAVEKSAPIDLSLRDKDRYLWGKSFYEQLMDDIEKGFKVK
ncbi:MAG: hypothetical protein WBC40_01055 [Halobacteriota archaeon]